MSSTQWEQRFAATSGERAAADSAHPSERLPATAQRLRSSTAGCSMVVLAWIVQGLPACRFDLLPKRYNCKSTVTVSTCDMTFHDVTQNYSASPTRHGTRHGTQDAAMCRYHRTHGAEPVPLQTSTGVRSHSQLPSQCLAEASPFLSRWRVGQTPPSVHRTR